MYIIQVNVKVTILDVNDNAPRFTDGVTTGYVSENASINTPVSYVLEYQICSTCIIYYPICRSGVRKNCHYLGFLAELGPSRFFSVQVKSQVSISNFKSSHKSIGSLYSQVTST